jgi:hypothetical protein
MNSFINYLFETDVKCDRKLQFNNRMPFHSYSGIWDSWQEGFSAGRHTSRELACTAKSVRSHIPASILHVLTLRLTLCGPVTSIEELGF